MTSLKWKRGSDCWQCCSMFSC